MTDKETMQMALDALNMYQTTLRAVVKVTGEQYTGDPSILIRTLEKALARPERRPLTDYGLHGLLLGIDPEMKRLPIGFKKFARAIEAAHGIKETE